MFVFWTILYLSSAMMTSLWYFNYLDFYIFINRNKGRAIQDVVRPYEADLNVPSGGGLPPDRGVGECGGQGGGLRPGTHRTQGDPHVAENQKR